MLQGKNAIVTGSNRGIGLAIVELFAENNANIWACARSQSDEFEQKLQGLSSKYDVDIRPVYFDVSDDDAVRKAVRNIGKEVQSIDILVNNAGISVERLFSMTSIDLMRKTLDVNFLPQVRLAQMVVRYMIKNKAGSIVNVASVSGMDNETGGMAYGSSKAAVLYSSQIMAAELGTYGIRVNAVSPGFIDTDMWKGREEVKKKILSETPLHRQGMPKEVAQVILFLASDMASYITGQNIVVDGGRKRVGNTWYGYDIMQALKESCE